MISEGREWAVGSVVVDFPVFGAPRFSVHRTQNPLKEVFWVLWTENRGAPKTRNSTTTDPTPHSWPSDDLLSELGRHLQQGPHHFALGHALKGVGVGVLPARALCWRKAPF